MLPPSISPCFVPSARAIAVLSAALALSGCSAVDETTSKLLSSNTGATAVFGAQLLQGQANFTGTREATILLQGIDAPGLSCFGNLRFSATASGVVGFSCNDGQSVSIPFQSLSPLRGSGRRQMGDKVFALTYGFPAETAAPFLGIATERLVHARPIAPAASPAKRTAIE